MKRNLCTPAITSFSRNLIKVFTLAFLSLLISNVALASRFKVTGLTVGSQSASATYGTAVSPTYGVTLAETSVGGGQMQDKFTITWSGGTPTGVTTSIGGGLFYTPSGNNQVVTITINTSSSTPAGTYTFTITNTENNGGSNSSNTGTLVVNPKVLTITGSAAKTYGTTLTSGTGSNAFTSSGLANGETIGSVTSLFGTGAAATDAPGTYAGQATPSAATGGTFNASNYTISYNAGNIVVNKATLTITANNQSKTYGNAFTFAGTEFTASGLKNSDAVTSATITSSGAAANAAAGSYTISIGSASGLGLSNYNISYNAGTMTVNKAVLTVSGLTANDKTYDGTTTATLTGGSLIGVISGDNVSLVPSGTFVSKNVGSGISVTSTSTLSGSSAGNYTLTQPTGLSANINQAALTITANNVSKTYGSTLTGGTGSTAFTSSGLASGETIGSVTIAYGTGAAATASVGSYSGSVTPSAATGGSFSASNYIISYASGNITVNQANLTITANGVTKTYGTALSTTTITGSTAFTSSGLKNGETIGSVSITYYQGAGSGAPANASVFGSPYSNQVTPSAAIGGTFNAGNYNISYSSGNIDVNAANMTITATGPVRNYGDAASSNNTYYTNNFTYTGAVNGETVTNVFFVISGSGNSATAAAGTTYTVTPGNYFFLTPPTGGNGFAWYNYNITYVTYNGTVGKAPLTITANNVTKTYGAALTNPTTGSAAFTSSGLKNGQTIGSVTINYTTGAASTDAVGTYAGAVVPSAATGGTFNANNYSITYVHGTVTINAANLTITASSVNKPYGTTLTTGPASSGFTTSGLVAGESISTVYLSYSAGYNATDPIGTTGTITASLPVTGSGTFNTGNYNIIFVPGTITVGAATFDWTGAVNSDWATPGNWSVNGVQQTTVYPGMNEATDVVRIGVIAYTNSANQPTISANLPNAITTLTFGSLTSPITLNLASNITLNISGTTTLNAGSEVVNLNGASGSSLIIGGDYVNNTGATFNNNSSAPITISGVFTNSGTNNFGSALLTFNNPGNPITFTTSGTQVFTNVVFANGHYLLKKPAGPGSGKFNIASNGTLTLTGNVNVTTASATLTLLSDATGSASVAPITDASTVNGTVSVQRYMQAHRGYRLMASPVNAGTDANGNNVYSVNYLKSSVYLTGTTGTAGLFDKTGNPTLYIYREDITPNGSSFLTSSYRGISDLTAGNNTPPTYALNLEASTYSIPVSNGYLFYYRGSRNQKTLAQLTTVGAAATTDTLTASGTLNVGQIIFKNWYAPGSTSLSYSNPDSTLVGFNLAGNPYASSIDWETYNTTSTTSGIYAQNLSDFVYEFNPTTANYDVYEAGQGGAVYTNNATRTIVSGQGFFVLAKAAGAQLIFNESAKNTTLQNIGPNLYMGKPNEMAANNQFLKLQIAADAINKDDIVIAFNNSAKSSFDITEDAPYKTGLGKVNLASLSTDKKLLAINRMPLKEKAIAIPLKVGATANGTYSLNMSSIQGVPELYDIWLMDAYRKDSVDMRHNKSYMFDINFADANSYGAHRFTLIMHQNPALAYHLLNFTASKATGRQVQINWVTENEANYTNFTVERSIDNGKTYDIIGNVQAAGAGTYGLLDKNPGENNLYRLKQEDINNNITYSHIIPVGFTNQGNGLAGNNINVYPNPAGSTVNLAINTAVTDKATTFNFTITNSYGLVIKQGTSAQANWQTNVSDLLPGTYIIQVINNNDKSFVGKSKLVKL